jgi:hypothetical protein
MSPIFRQGLSLPEWSHLQDSILLTSRANIGLGWMWVTVINTLAYYDSELTIIDLKRITRISSYSFQIYVDNGRKMFCRMLARSVLFLLFVLKSPLQD